MLNVVQKEWQKEHKLRLHMERKFNDLEAQHQSLVIQIDTAMKQREEWQRSTQLEMEVFCVVTHTFGLISPRV